MSGHGARAPDLGRARRGALGCLLAGALASAVLLASAPPALAASATLTTPASSSTYGGPSIPISYSLSNPPEDNISLVFEYTSGSNATAGDTWTVLLAGVADSGSFNMSASNPTAASQVVSVTPSGGATGTSLPGGTYDVTLTYSETSPTRGLAVQSPTATGVVIDTTTQTPVLTTPDASTAYSSPLPVAYTLPEQALANSVTITFSGSVTREVTLASSLDAAGTHSFSLVTSNLISSPDVASAVGGNTLPDGTYAVTFAYQDQYGNPVATASATAVTVDTVTLAPVLGSPTAGTYTGTLPLTYTLPEAGEAGTVTATFTSSAATRTVTLADVSAGTHTVNVDPTDLGSSAGVSSVVGGPTLPDGTYNVTLSYEDALGNPAAQVTVTNIVLQPATTPAPAPSTPAAPDDSAPPPTAAAGGAKGEGTLAATWRSHVHGHQRWVVKASFKPQAGAASYRFVATLGHRSKTGTCRQQGKAARARIVCTATIAHPGAWKLEATAESGTGTLLAAQTRRVRLRSAHRHR